ncbi:MAG: thioredoxin family protein [Muribaculaceae bacterium]|nr:thioredoxin family protein [Muribaculaceae bacterium]
MELVDDINILNAFVEENKFCLLYIQAPDCGLCSIMLDKIGKMAQRFDNLHSIRVELLVVPEVAGAFLVATAPTVLLFAHGKEVYRAGTFIDTMELERILTKWSENLT